MEELKLLELLHHRGSKLTVKLKRRATTAVAVGVTSEIVVISESDLLSPLSRNSCYLRALRVRVVVASLPSSRISNLFEDWMALKYWKRGLEGRCARHRVTTQTQWEVCRLKS